jgi:hypothetical protein
VEHFAQVSPSKGSKDGFAGASISVGTTDLLDVDFGFTQSPYALIGGCFWYDDNHNGIKGPGEEPVPGGTVELQDEAGNRVYDVNDRMTTETDEKGMYLFHVRPSRSYRIRFVMPEQDAENGIAFTEVPVKSAKGVVDSDVDANGITEPVMIMPGDKVQTIDAGLSCGCAGIEGDSFDAMSPVGKMLLIGLPLMMGWLLVRREEQQKSKSIL